MKAHSESFMTRSNVIRRYQRGQALIEYAAVGAVLVTALFFLDYDGRTGAQYLTEMIRAFFRNLTYLISLP